MGYATIQPRFEDVVDKIYAAVDDSVLWNDVAGDIARAADAVSCSLQLRSGADAKIVGAAGYREFDAKLYEQQYARQDIRAQVLMGLPADQVHLLHHYMPQERFVGSSYYNEFFRRITEGYWSAATWITLDRGAGVGLGIGIHRSRRADPEDSAQIEILGSLSPHLRRAGRLHLKLNDVRTRVSQLSDALDHMIQPAILADCEGRVVIANTAAGRLFEPDRVLGVDHSGKLVTCSVKATRLLREAIEAASRPADQADARQAADIIVASDDQTPRISLSVLPLQRRAATSRGTLDGGSIMILAREFATGAVSVEALRSAFSLSPAEARLLRLLATGASLRQASEIVGVSYSTVMSQLKSCFQKTGTHRQAELVALAVRLGSSGA
ncbi:MAG TPA: helix-turn-helix transcriptional regulator [Dongiaceae bacterium]|nr:helix-turn-helix transcriptional regulator [Dongiaceae bacterium]